MALNLFNPPDVDSGECEKSPWDPCPITGVVMCECEVCESPERCGHDCDCDSEAIHEAAMDVAMREFLRDPGPAPARFTAEAIERAESAMERQRLANRIAALVLDYADDMYLPPLVPEADYGDLAVLLSLEVL